MAKVAIITRCYNRLEYTVMCVRSINQKSGFDDYEHIIIDQGSTDGTREWLKSLEKENFYKIKVKYNEKNSGDAGGMLDGFRMISDDCKYILQFDNDCEVITDNFLSRLVRVMDDDEKIGITMMKRKGVGTPIGITKKIVINGENYGFINKSTCCMIIRRDVLEKINTWITGEKIGWGFSISSKIKRQGYKILKSLDNKVYHIDTTKGQAEKYPKYFSSKKTGTNYRVINYNNI
jgi:GT2 family glycosyltransferase